MTHFESRFNASECFPRSVEFNTLNIKAKKLKPNAIIPTKSRQTDAGWDLYAAESVMLETGVPTKISTGIALEIPTGFYGQIQGRSGLGSKGIAVLGGVIDSEYRGDIIVCLHLNKGNEFTIFDETDSVELVAQDKYIIEEGDKIAQIIIHQIPNTQMVEVEELGESDRGEKGFGSSGR